MHAHVVFALAGCSLARRALASFLGEMAGHAVAVLDGRARPLCTGEDGLAAVRVLEALEGRG